MSLSVCIPVKNRNYNLKGCLEALARCTGVFEVIVADFHSTDTDYSEYENIKVVKVDGDFSIGKGKNEAAEASSGDILFFLDADCCVTQAVIDRINKLVPQGWVYAPVMNMQNEDGSFDNNWAVHSYGQIAVTREQWESHKWVEWTSYGGDDNLFYAPFSEIAIRDLPEGFNHQWHSQDERLINYDFRDSVDLEKWRKENE